ncbi:MAG TPA: hypothetical protein VN451_06890 [Chitinophagaceae bacterium]|nr:hypothetical protein [Chitinophagaceae bacterium]
MKFTSLVRRMYKWASGKNAERFRLLQSQRLLLRQGIVATAEVIETSLAEESVGNLLPVRLWLKLKKADGSFIYTHTITLVPLKDIPVGGQILRIKYLPENLSSVIILQ